VLDRAQNARDVGHARTWDVYQIRMHGNAWARRCSNVYWIIAKSGTRTSREVESRNGLAKTDVLELLKFISLYVTPEIIQDVQKLDPAECLCEPQQHKLRPVESVTVTGVGHG